MTQSLAHRLDASRYAAGTVDVVLHEPIGVRAI